MDLYKVVLSLIVITLAVEFSIFYSFMYHLCYCNYFLLYSMKEYEERAVYLALNRPKLLALTNKLKATRLTCPLFDTARWVKLK